MKHRALRGAAVSTVAAGVIGFGTFAAVGTVGAVQRHSGSDAAAVLYVAAPTSASSPATAGGKKATSGWKKSHGAPGCDNAAYTTISAAVTAANPGSTIVVCPGTYKEDVVVTKSLKLLGRRATIDATGLNNGVQIVTSGVTVEGFTITGAIGEGILVGVDSATDPNVGLVESEGIVLSHEWIADNNVSYDNTGFSGPGGSTSTCVYGGDCGGGIHFNVVSHSVITHNTVLHNADGVLLTDDYGPNFANTVSWNNVSDNAVECGITLPSHSSDAVSYDTTTMQVTGRNPTLGGVYDNSIVHNVANDNGTVPYSPAPGVESGSGAGVGLFGSGPGSAVYDNFVAWNSLSGNGLAGITVHAHLPGGEDVNGNRFIANFIGTNNVVGDPEDGTPGISDPVTTGISVYSGAATLKVTIARNYIADNTDGIWVNSPPVMATIYKNVFHNDTNPVVNAG